MSKDGTFKTHIENVADAAKKMCDWIQNFQNKRSQSHDPVVEITSSVKAGLLQSAVVSIKLLKPSRDPSPEKWQASGI